MVLFGKDNMMRSGQDRNLKEDSEFGLRYLQGKKGTRKKVIPRRGEKIYGKKKGRGFLE